MARFSRRVVRSASQPAEDVGVMISYHGVLGGHDEKRTDSDGWVEFHNHDGSPETIWVHGEELGEHSLADGKTYSFTISLSPSAVVLFFQRKQSLAVEAVGTVGTPARPP